MLNAMDMEDSKSKREFSCLNPGLAGDLQIFSLTLAELFFPAGRAMFAVPEVNFGVCAGATRPGPFGGVALVDVAILVVASFVAPFLFPAAILTFLLGLI